jgi:MYXO-CTERM domain-containing protein
MPLPPDGGVADAGADRPRDVAGDMAVDRPAVDAPADVRAEAGAPDAADARPVDAASTDAAVDARSPDAGVDAAGMDASPVDAGAGDASDAEVDGGLAFFDAGPDPDPVVAAFRFARGGGCECSMPTRGGSSVPPWASILLGFGAVVLWRRRRRPRRDPQLPSTSSGARRPSP